jgi:hypothetical protein
LKYVKPPETLLKQLEAYVEEKFEDEEDLREQVQNTKRRTPSSNGVTYDDPFIQRILRIKDIYPDTDLPLEEIIASLETLFTKDIPLYAFIACHTTTHSLFPELPSLIFYASAKHSSRILPFLKICSYNLAHFPTDSD